MKFFFFPTFRLLARSPCKGAMVNTMFRMWEGDSNTWSYVFSILVYNLYMEMRMCTWIVCIAFFLLKENTSDGLFGMLSLLHW